MVKGGGGGVSEIVVWVMRKERVNIIVDGDGREEGGLQNIWRSGMTTEI